MQMLMWVKFSVQMTHDHEAMSLATSTCAVKIGACMMYDVSVSFFVASLFKSLGLI
jgi:hypothetical protein